MQGEMRRGGGMGRRKNVEMRGGRGQDEHGCKPTLSKHSTKSERGDAMWNTAGQREREGGRPRGRDTREK